MDVPAYLHRPPQTWRRRGLAEERRRPIDGEMTGNEEHLPLIAATVRMAVSLPW